jgi:hypothetical protein
MEGCGDLVRACSARDRRRTRSFRSSESPRPACVVVVAGGRGQVVEPVGLLRAQLKAVCGDVLPEARDALGERRVDGPGVVTGHVSARPVQARTSPCPGPVEGCAVRAPSTGICRGSVWVLDVAGTESYAQRRARRQHRTGATPTGLPR